MNRPAIDNLNQDVQEYMVWSNGDAAHVISAMYTASIVSGEPRVDEESFELRFFSSEDIPEIFAEDHIAALDAYFRGVRYRLLQENRMDVEPIISKWRQ